MRLSDDRGGRQNVNQEDKITKGRQTVHRVGRGTSQEKAYTHEDAQRRRQSVTCSEKLCVHVGARHTGLIRSGLSLGWSATL